MKFNELNVSKSRSSRRVGRGISAGRGKTAGRGTKGQNSRAGNKHRPGFEGGQNPLMQRLPKLRGFRSIRAGSENIYTGQLNGLGTSVDNHRLAEAGLISSPYVKVKVIKNGQLKSKVSVKLQAASESAIVEIQNAGGKFDLVDQIARPKQKTSQEAKS